MNAWVYAAFAVALLTQSWLFFRDSRWALLKVLLSSALIALIWGMALSYESWLGWPAHAPSRSVKYQVISIRIEEPSPKGVGHLYLWVYDPEKHQSRNPFVYSGEADVPRAFELPFTALNEKRLQEARKAIAQGSTVTMTFSGNGADGASNALGAAIGGLLHGGANPYANVIANDTMAPQLSITEPPFPEKGD